MNTENMHVTEGDYKRFAIESINETVDKAISNKGNIEEKYNQKQISKVPHNVASIVSTASNGKIDISGKYIAVNGDNIWHEYQSHSNLEKEKSIGQIPLTPKIMKDAIAAIYDPDMVESIFADTSNPTQRQSFAYAKKSPDGHYIVVEAVGGKNNPNIVPVMVLQFSETKWNTMMSTGKTLGELFFENDSKKKSALDIAFNKNNRVIVAQFASEEAIASTPHSPRFNNSIPQNTEKVNRKSEKTDKSFALPDDDVSQSLREAEKKRNFGYSEGQEAKAEANENEKNETRIAAGMSDAERYELLKNKNITVSAKTDSEKLNSVMNQFDITEKNIEFSKYGDRVRLFKKLADEFGVFREYHNGDISIDFSFSKENMRESISKQRKNYLRFAKLLTCLDGVVDYAVGIEAHNRNTEGYKADGGLNNVYVFASAFADGENIIPVKLEVKEFSDKKNTLHVAIALESIKKNEIVKQEVAKDGVARQYSPSFTISIADFLRKINPSDESFYKYIPKQFFESDYADTNVHETKNALPDHAETVTKSERQDNGQNENKSRVDDWLKVNRLQLPLPNSQSNSATNSITEKKQKVNTNSEKTDKSFALPDDDVSQSLRETEKNRKNGIFD